MKYQKQVKICVKVTRKKIKLTLFCNIVFYVIIRMIVETNDFLTQLF